MISGAEPRALKSRLLADLEHAMGAGHPLQASAVAILVGTGTSSLMQQALGSAPRGAPGSDERLQRYLRNVVRVLCVAERHFGDLQAALHWYHEDRGPHGKRPTPQAFVAAGLMEEACRHLLRAPP
ncbi:hypothetical protein H8N03_16910 [Ramlibacter sp. USB13]|uniref:DUF2384 domain-containing protein n=1 Tax=Ramlibacter cellulosilyticus TaxID=2764187 RepID=A0A923SC61_9BURK|nr:hypothetical protein [Ramlibacter cellulosilyticus]MBC5784631.1 hypothetical protein [Ramlibacter cellulosilyticus]